MLYSQMQQEALEMYFILTLESSSIIYDFNVFFRRSMIPNNCLGQNLWPRLIILFFSHSNCYFGRLTYIRSEVIKGSVCMSHYWIVFVWHAISFYHDELSFYCPQFTCPCISHYYLHIYIHYSLFQRTMFRVVTSLRIHYLLTSSFVFMQCQKILIYYGDYAFLCS